MSDEVDFPDSEQIAAMCALLDKKHDKVTTPPPPGLTVPPVFFYIHFKAFLFLELGPDLYRKHDAFNLPPDYWAEEKLAAVTCGCRQISEWRGLSPDRPLEDIGIGGFYALLHLLHFELVSQALIDSDPVTMLDMMIMRHVVNAREITLYNRVNNPMLEKEPGPPCPYCGAPLRTPKAKQCRICGTDWHDPANILRRKAADPE